MAELTTVKSKETKYRGFEDFVSIPNWFYKSLGYDFLTGVKPNLQSLMLVSYFIICFISHIYNTYCLTNEVLAWNIREVEAKVIMRYAQLASFAINSSVKTIAFFINQRRIRDLVNKIKKLFPKTQAECSAYQVNNYYWPLWTRFIVAFFYVDCLAMVLGPSLQSTIVYVIRLIRFGSENARFPYLRCYPMDYGFASTGFFGYVLTELVEATFSQFIVNLNLGIDLWVCCIASQLIMHFDYIRNTLLGYQPSVKNEVYDCRFLGALVQKHQHILSLQKELDEIFGVLLVYNLLSTASTLCCVAFYSIVRGINLETASFMLFFFIASAQFYMICHHGQLLITKSENISVAAYEHRWYDGSIKYKKLLLLLMIRAQKPAALSARGFMIISLDTFTILMNITYRSFALVRTILK